MQPNSLNCGDEVLGLSMGGYIAFEILRQADSRAVSLALLDTVLGPIQPNNPPRVSGLRWLRRSPRESRNRG
jgi:pimeloyl-ACP methyl ester carboxylesterase